MKKNLILFLLAIVLAVSMSISALATTTNEGMLIADSPPAMTTFTIDYQVQLNSPPASMGMNQLSDSILTTTPTDATRCVTAANQLQNSEVKKNFALMTLMKSGTKTQLASESQWAIVPAVYLNVVTSESPPMTSNFDGSSLITDQVVVANNTSPPFTLKNDELMLRRNTDMMNTTPSSSLTSQVPIARPEQIDTSRQSVAFNESYGMYIGQVAMMVTVSDRGSPVYTNNWKNLANPTTNIST